MGPPPRIAARRRCNEGDAIKLTLHSSRHCVPPGAQARPRAKQPRGYVTRPLGCTSRGPLPLRVFSGKDGAGMARALVGEARADAPTLGLGAAEPLDRHAAREMTAGLVGNRDANAIPFSPASRNPRTSAACIGLNSGRALLFGFFGRSQVGCSKQPNDGLPAGRKPGGIRGVMRLDGGPAQSWRMEGYEVAKSFGATHAWVSPRRPFSPSPGSREHGSQHDRRH